MSREVKLELPTLPKSLSTVTVGEVVGMLAALGGGGTAIFSHVISSSSVRQIVLGIAAMVVGILSHAWTTRTTQRKQQAAFFPRSPSSSPTGLSTGSSHPVDNPRGGAVGEGITGG